MLELEAADRTLLLRVISALKELLVLAAQHVSSPPGRYRDYYAHDDGKYKSIRRQCRVYQNERSLVEYLP